VINGLTLFPFEPNWVDPLKLKAEYVTTVNRESITGLIPRASERDYGRRSLGLSLWLQGDVRRSWDAWRELNPPFSLVGVPLWSEDGIELTAAVLSGGAMLTVSETDNIDWRGELILVNTGDGTEIPVCEAAAIEAVTEGSITLTAGLTNGFAIGTKVLPLLRARMQEDYSEDVNDEELSVSDVTFLEELANLSAVSLTNAPSTYLGVPIFPLIVNELKESTVVISQGTHVVAGGIAREAFATLKPYPRQSWKHLFTFETRADEASLWKFFADRRGRWDGFWLASLKNELKLSADVGSGDTFLTLENFADYSNRFNLLGVRRAVIFILNGSSIWYRRVLNLAGGGANKIAIDSPIGTALVASQTKIGLMQMVQFAADDLEITFDAPTMGDADITFSELEREYPCDGVTITLGALANGSLGTVYNQSAAASGGTGPYTYSTIAGALPNGLSPVNASTGAVTGTPSAVGTFNFTIQAVDAAGCVGDQAYTVVIACPAITLTNPFIDGNDGDSYDETVGASGGTGPYTFAVTSGSLPTGLALNDSTGVVSGTLGGAGTSSFTITATDANECAGSRGYTISVSCPSISFVKADGITPFTGDPAPMQTGTSCTSYDFTVKATGGTGPYTYAIISGCTAAVMGVVLNASTGEFTAVAGNLVAGDRKFTYQATDANGCTASIACELKVCQCGAPCSYCTGGVATPGGILVNLSGLLPTCATDEGSRTVFFMTGAIIGQVEGQPCVWSGVIGYWQQTSYANRDCTGAVLSVSTGNIEADVSRGATNYAINIKNVDGIDFQYVGANLPAGDCMTGQSVTVAYADQNGQNTDTVDYAPGSGLYNITATIGPSCLVPGGPTSC
jgi:hypothetical protein